MNNAPCLPSVVALVVLAIGSGTGARAELIHRFSFDGVVARDSVGAVETRLMGPNAKLSEGKLVLNNPLTAFGDQLSYLEFASPVLPAGAATASLVFWLSAKDTGEFARVLDIGDSEGTEGVRFLYFTPRTAEGYARVAITGTNVFARVFADFEAIDDGRPHGVAIVFNGDTNRLHVYVDGKAATPPVDLGANTLDKVNPVHNWIGRSGFSADPGLTAMIEEFRVYSQALTPQEIAAIHEAGPDALPGAR